MRTWQLFAVAVLVWGTTWHAIVYQIAEAPVAWGVALRFALAGLICGAVAAWRGERLWPGSRGLAMAAFQGLFMYSLSYLCVYAAEQHVPSGLVAVGYSLSPLINGVAAHLIWGTPLERRFVLGGVMGVSGVVMIFWPEVRQGSDATGALLTLAAVLMSSVGSLSSSRNRERGMPFWSTLAWGMFAGAAASALLALWQGDALPWPLSAAWWVSLLYLAAAGSALAFACFLTLQQRIGPGPASTVGVATPVIALIVSTLMEGFEPQALTVLGAALALAGNAMALGLWRGLKSKVSSTPSA